MPAIKTASIVVVGRLPVQVQKALGSDVREVLLSADSLAKQRGELARSVGHTDLDPKHYGVLSVLINDPTVVLHGREKRILMLKQSGAVWMAVVKTTASRAENYVLSFRRAGKTDVQAVLGGDDEMVVYGDPGELATGDEA